MTTAPGSPLGQEWRADYGYDGYDNYKTRDEAARNVADFNATNEPDGGWKDGEQAVLMHRYVTEWTADE